MNREEVLAFTKSAYKTDPEYLWKRSPDSAVLRHTENQKWYGIVMRVSWNALGMDAEGEVDVLDVKCGPDMMGAILMTKGILPGYHMNKKSWISILLDGTVPDELIKNLLDLSFELTAGKKSGGRSNGKRITKWIIPANPKYYNVDAAFDAEDTILWKQSSQVHADDTIYLYVGAPFSAIRYKCKAVEVDLPYQYSDDNLTIKKAMRIQKIEKYDAESISFERMKQHGVYAVRGPRSIPDSLVQEIEHLYH